MPAHKWDYEGSGFLDKVQTRTAIRVLGSRLSKAEIAERMGKTRSAVYLWASGACGAPAGLLDQMTAEERALYEAGDGRD